MHKSRIKSRLLARWPSGLGKYLKRFRMRHRQPDAADLRRYIRHPADIPIDFSLAETPSFADRRTRNIGCGGLCFTTDKPMPSGVGIHLNIPILSHLWGLPCEAAEPVEAHESADADEYCAAEGHGSTEGHFSAEGIVAWCRQEGEGYTVGVQFTDSPTQFGVRMIEQICHIEHYRSGVAREEGRTLTSEEAAEEWIARYAAEFPSTADT